MSAWLIIALVILGLGIIFALLAERNCWSVSGGSCFGISIGVCVLEAIVYGFYKLIPWVLSWNTAMMVKISFIAIPITCLLGIMLLCFAMNKEQKLIKCGTLLMLAAFVASVIICPVFAFITSIGWRIGILVFFGIIWALFFGIGLCCIFSKEDHTDHTYNGAHGHAVSYGDRAEVVEYYPSRREYRKSRRGHSVFDETEQQPWIF